MLMGSAAVGFMVLVIVMTIGLLPDPQTHAWAGVLGGPILMGSAALAYWGLERMVERRERERPLSPTVPSAPQPSASPELPSTHERTSVSLTLVIVIGHVVAALVGSGLLGWVQQLIFGVEVEEQETILEVVRGGAPLELALLALSAVILAPITEEAVFRGMFFRRLIGNAGMVAAWVLPALLFALAHWNPVGLVIYAWLGLVFAHAYLRTGRLWAAMLTHAGCNAVTLSLLIYAPELAAAGGS